MPICCTPIEGLRHQGRWVWVACMPRSLILCLSRLCDSAPTPLPRLSTAVGKGQGPHPHLPARSWFLSSLQEEVGVGEGESNR